MSQVLSYSSVVATGAGWSNGSNVQTDNGVYAVCDLGGSGSSGILKIALTNPTDPEDHTSHVIKVNGKRSSPLIQAGSQTVTVELRESGTLRASYSFSFGISDQDKTYTLSTGEAAAIGNYNNLELWITVDTTEGEEGYPIIYLDYVELSIPSLAVPAQVTGVAASDGTFTNKVRVTYNSAARAVTYKVLRNGSVIASGVSGTTYDDFTATPGVTYQYSAKGTNSSGDGPESASNSGYRQPTPVAGTGILIVSTATVSGVGESGSVGSGALVAGRSTVFGFGTNFTGGLGASRKTWNLRASDGD